VKAPATKTAKSGQPGPSVAVSAATRSAAVSAKTAAGGKPTAKKPAKVAAKSGVQLAKPAAAVKKALPAAKAAATPTAGRAAPAVSPVKPGKKSVAPSGVKSPVKTAAKAAVKASIPPAAKPAASKPAAKPAASKPVVQAALDHPAKAVKSAKASRVVAAAAEPAVKPVAKTAPKTPAKATRAAPAPAPVAVEPTPRPLGKRAAKKVMMEQMTQAAVVPTHAPDAAKATFSHMNERVVMIPPVPSTIRKDPARVNNWKTLSIEQLTDQDVQAMPDSEYMSDLQLAYFRRKLSQLKADMLTNAGETTEHLREDTVVVPDPADRATIEEEHALELRTRDRERKLLKKIEQAIVRIDAGDYGYCEETGEAIGVGRLMARPTASLSLEAQQRRELKQKMFGD
jgi:DnaK suppressor protein